MGEITLNIPVLRLSGPDPLDTLEFLASVAYEYVSTKSTYISNLEDTILEDIRRREHSLKITPHSVIEVQFYELEADIRPAKQTTRAFKDAFHVVTSEYLQNAVPHLSHVSLKGWDEARLNKLIAVSTIGPPQAFPPTLSELELDQWQGRINREYIALAFRNRVARGAVAGNLIQTQKPRTPRPSPFDIAPITIYHPVFGHFLSFMNDLEDTELTHEELGHAHSFIARAVDFYGVVDNRIKALAPSMNQAVHPTILDPVTLPTASGTMKPHGRASSVKTPDGFRIITTITEVNVDFGIGGCDPIAKAECDYVAIYSSDEASNLQCLISNARTIREVCCCPALLIGMTGPYIMISGAVFADRLIVQNLTDYILVVPGPTIAIGRTPLDAAGYRIARFFRALKMCIEELDEYYTKVVHEYLTPKPQPSPVGILGGTRPPAPRVHTSFIGPHFTRYRDHVSAEEFILAYKKPLSPDSSTAAVFLAEARRASAPDGEGVQVVVKFAYNYDDASPRGPRLRYCAFEPDVGFWIIVMDLIAEDAEACTSRGVLESPRAPMVMVHERGSVLGDLEQPNALFIRDSVALVDFDWCGMAGTRKTSRWLECTWSWIGLMNMITI
ncbi:hypothetical protein C8Q74DRAFT_1434935 [Fomes fomentarius]|nr:hypothetical protein C8Q74DRAFT_1434935 [Fomes fomentarius]